MIAAAPSVRGSMGCMSEQGFIDVGFLCPGAQYVAPDGTIWKSGGAGLRYLDDSKSPSDQVYWENCVEPLADVLSFATGKTRSLEGKSIQSYVASVRSMTENAGVIGWSFGGNLAVHAMARYGQRFPGLKWYASYESPIRSQVDVGRGSGFEPNRFYDPNTDKIDFDRLRYSPEMPIWAWDFRGLPPEPDWPHGGLYLDGDGNGRFNKDSDYAFWAAVELGPPLKVFYSLMVTREARDRSVFGDKWPAHIATLEEVERRESRVNPLRHIPDAVKKLPHLAVLVFESQQSHVSGFIHLDAIAQVNAWLDARAGWVRFNPDVHYVEMAMGKEASREIQYPARLKISREVIGDLVEPVAKEGGPTVKEGMTAVACELADRTYENNWAAVLTGVLVQPKHGAVRR
jgi:hypothetical protein